MAGIFVAPDTGFDVSTLGVFGYLDTTVGPLGGAREVQVGVRYDF